MKYKILLVALLFCVIVPDFSFGSSFIGAIKNAFSTIQQSPKKTSASRVQAGGSVQQSATVVDDSQARRTIAKKSVQTHRALIKKVESLVSKVPKKDKAKLTAIIASNKSKLMDLEAQLQNNAIDRKQIKLTLIEVQKQIKLMQTELRRLNK